MCCGATRYCITKGQFCLYDVLWESVVVTAGSCHGIIVLSMKPLIETNPYLRDPEKREQYLERNTYDSSVFEGARGLRKPASHSAASRPRSRASVKKAVRAS